MASPTRHGFRVSSSSQEPLDSGEQHDDRTDRKCGQAEDQLFARKTQGAPNQSPSDDTMFDLMMDGLGGVIGAILGPLYIRRSRRSRVLVDAFAEFIEGRQLTALSPTDRSRSP